MPAGTPATPQTAADADEVHLSFPRRVYDDLHEVLFPTEVSHPFAGKFERGAFCVVNRSTGVKRVTYLVREIVRPESERDLDASNRQDGAIKRDRETSIASRLIGKMSGGDDYLGHHLRFSQEYHHRALERARELDGGILRVHTHPGTGGVAPSTIDSRSAERVFDGDVDRLPPAAPLVAAITNEAEAWSARVYEFGADRQVSVTPATAIRLVGPEFEKRETPDSPLGPAGAVGRIDHEEQDSTIQAWGADGQRTLAGLRVGLVGCGGVGSILAEHLSRLGVGELVLVDFDRLEPANRNRAQGATRMDVRQRRLKTRVAERVAHMSATSQDFDTTVVDGSPVEADPEFTAVPELLDCDVIVEAVDAARPRLVLDHIASAHCIPVISGGSRLHVETDGMLGHEAKVEVNATGPDWPCFECQRVWRPQDVEYEHEDPRFRGERGYVDGGVDPDELPRSPSVIGFNAMVAGLVQRRLQAIVQQIGLRVVPPTRLNPRDVELDPASIIACANDCGRAPIAAGDQHSLPTGTDWSMRYERDDIPMPEIKTNVTGQEGSG